MGQKMRHKAEFQGVKLIIFPDDTLKAAWDAVIMLLMVYTVTITPYRVAFIEIDTLFWTGMDYAIDILFGVDVIMNCFMAYTNSEEVLITNHYRIFKNYLKTWMFLDILSCIPFTLILSNSNWGVLLRLSKLPRLYRLLKIIKLLRLIKVLKNRNKVLNWLECLSKLNAGMERLMYFTLGLLAICHLFACILYFISQLNSDNVNNWVVKYGIQDATLGEKYLASAYWTVTILCTIGYGDITPSNDMERCTTIFVELAGVFLYSYTIGTITSLMADMDKRHSKLDSKIIVLQDIAKKYNLSRKFYEKLKSALEYNQTMLNKERSEMIANLPKKLAMQLNIVMNKSLIDKNKFFDGKQIKFITTVIDYLKPLKVKSKEIIYRKGEFTEEMFFIKTGEVVLYDILNEVEIVFEMMAEGDYFGDVEVFLSETRESSAKATKPSELFTLSREELFTNVLFYFEDLKLSMIIDTNHRRETFNKKREEVLSAYRQANNIVYNGSGQSDMVKESTRLNPGDYHRKEYASLRKTLAPTTRAMLEENDDASVDDLKLEMGRLAAIVEALEEQVYEIIGKANENNKDEDEGEQSEEKERKSQNFSG
jgi:hypothetical protein